MTTKDTTQEFGKWRSRLWPVHTFELKKVLPITLLFFFISFNYTILRDAKDTLIVTSSGAEAIPFLKVYGVIPAAVLFMLVFAKLSNILSRQQLFYATLFPFLIYFALFSTVVYPNRELMQPNAFADYLLGVFPVGLTGLVECIRNWPYAMFFIMAELWGSVVLSLLFWGFANEITKVCEAKRFYTLFLLGANTALIFSGEVIKRVADIRDTVPAGVDPWGVALNYLMGILVFAGILIAAIYFWINRYILTDARFYTPDQPKKAKKSKPKLSMMESFKFLGRSKYIGCLAILVIAYGMSINLVEVTWKSQVKLQYPNPNDYMTFMGNFSQQTGLVTICMLLMAGNAIRRGWGFAAMITPVILLVTGIGFFGFIFLGKGLGSETLIMGYTPLMLAVVIGGAQNILTKSAKYACFDSTKEIAYIPLDQESKVKGKAAIDVVGARLGKSGGSFVQQGLFVAFGSIALITPYIAGILFVAIGVWIVAIRSLNKQFVDLSEQREKEAHLAAASKAEAKSTGEKLSVDTAKATG